MEQQKVTTINLGAELIHTNVYLYEPMINRYVDGIEDIMYINCRDLRNLDGDGLAILVITYFKLRWRGKRLFLTNLTGQPKQLLTMLGIIYFFGDYK